MKQSVVLTLSVFALGLFSWSCQQQTPFGGPVYDFTGNLERDSILIAEYLKTSPIEGRRIDDPSGVVIFVQEESTAIKPGPGNLVYCNYTGRLLDGAMFDTNNESVARENNIFDPTRKYRIFQFSLGGSEAIRGFDIGFRNMNSGSKGVLVIPSPWGYQDRTTIPRVPANSILVFEVEFLGLD